MDRKLVFELATGRFITQREEALVHGATQDLRSGFACTWEASSSGELRPDHRVDSLTSASS
jgi:hypothetical protein